MSQESNRPVNRYQKAVEVLQKGREVMMRDLTEEILDRAEDFTEGGFLFQEFLENQGTKLHFLYLMVNQLEQSAETFEETQRKQAQADARKAKKSAGARAPKQAQVEFDEHEMIEFTDFDEMEPAPKKKSRKRRRKPRTEPALAAPMDEDEASTILEDSN